MMAKKGMSATASKIRREAIEKMRRRMNKVLAGCNTHSIGWQARAVAASLLEEPKDTEVIIHVLDLQYLLQVFGEHREKIASAPELTKKELDAVALVAELRKSGRLPR